VTTLNTYLSTIVEVLLKYDATINKFGGDSIMAIWNVPAPCENHPLMAVKAAKEAQDAIEEIHEKNQGLPKIGFGIGINTGMAVAGNTGSKDRMEYTVIGDTVNLAARLTGVTPAGKLWIGSKTFELVKGHIKAKPLHALEVKGKREPIEAYEVIDVISDSK
jgi:adenylate cyclase